MPSQTACDGRTGHARRLGRAFRLGLNCRPGRAAQTSLAALAAAALAAALFPAVARGDFFGAGENAFELPFVTVGAPGNAPDTTGAPNPAGSVGYPYRIGEFEVPEHAVRKANAQSALDGAPLGLTLDERGPDKPATGLSWFEAARFVNWLNEDAGFAPAYKFDDGPGGSGAFQLWAPGDAGFNPANRFRNRLARYVLPSVDEWYKAAFYDPAKDAGAGGYWDYPTGSDDPPLPVASGTDAGTAVWNQITGPADVQLAGGASPWGTVGQGGNVFEWQEGPLGGVLSLPTPDVRAFRGGDSVLSNSAFGLSNLSVGDRLSNFPGGPLGFRIASVPEPRSIFATLALALYTTAVRRNCVRYGIDRI
ncbi:MAG: SUMF1/EgtB/PvdO family nonheme iron enzyme [Planctomycetota bacterium]